MTQNEKTNVCKARKDDDKTWRKRGKNRKIRKPVENI